LDLPLDDVSATKLREALAESDHAALRAGIPDSVLAVIRARGLYGRSDA
jgi:nicotinic acid mononucleotide adenylyltransferase